MRLTKQQRAILREKYGGKCSYCGCDLPDLWAADHLKPVVRLYDGSYMFPENNNIDNLVPACMSCNILKSNHTLEGFRDLIVGFIKSLNRDSTQYRFAKRYGLIKEIEAEVKFYFEKI